MLKLSYKTKASIVFDLHIDKWDYQGLSWLKGRIGKDSIYSKVNATNGKYNFTINQEILDNISKDNAIVYLLCSDDDKVTKVLVKDLQIKSTSINRLPKTVTISLNNDFTLKPNRHLELKVEKEDEIDISSLVQEDENIDSLTKPITGDRVVFGISSELEHIYPNIYTDLVSAFVKHHVKYETIENVNDVWVKEFMPIIFGKNRVVSYKYDPDYLRRYQNKHLKTDLTSVTINDNPLEIDYHSDITFNGNNYLLIDNTLLMTTQLYGDNCHIEDQSIVDSKVKDDLDVDSIVVVPKTKYSNGCINSMVRVIDNETILVNDFSGEAEEFQTRFNDAIKLLNKKVVVFPYVEYMDYIDTNNLIIVPFYGNKKDEEALEKLKKIFPDKIVEGINALDIVNTSIHPFSSIVTTVYR